MLFHKRFISIHIIGNIEYSLYPQSSHTLVEATISDFHSELLYPHQNYIENL